MTSDRRASGRRAAPGPKRPDRPGIARIIAAGVGLAGLYVANAILDPAPLPVLGVVVAGLLAYVLGASRRALLWSVFAGCVIASVVHAYSHASEGRVESVAAVAGHVLAEAALGLLVGAALLWIGHALGSSMPSTLGRPRR